MKGSTCILPLQQQPQLPSQGLAADVGAGAGGGGGIAGEKARSNPVLFTEKEVAGKGRSKSEQAEGQFQAQ